MKIIHTSDIHLGAPFSARLSADKARQRKAELIETFRRITSEAVRLGAKLVIIAGDLFDTDNLSLPLCKRVMDIIEETEGIDYLYLPGNHEQNGFLECGLKAPNNLKVFGDDWTYYNYGDITVAGRRNISRKMFDTLDLSENGKNIVVLHGAIADGSCSEGVIGISDCKQKHIDYLALGHYHSYQRTPIDRRGEAVYCGTPEGRGFDEAGQKGFVVIDTDSSAVSHSFVPFAKRTVHKLQAMIDRSMRQTDVEKAVLRTLSDIPDSDIVRVCLAGEKPVEMIIDTDGLLARWADKYYYFELRDETKIKINPNDYAYDKSLKGEFIRLVMSKNDITEEDKELIIRCGIAALMGEIADI